MLSKFWYSFIVCLDIKRNYTALINPNSECFMVDIYLDFPLSNFFRISKKRPHADRAPVHHWRSAWPCAPPVAPPEAPGRPRPGAETLLVSENSNEKPSNDAKMLS